MLLLEELSLQLSSDPEDSVIPNLPAPPQTLRSLEIGADPTLRIGPLGAYIRSAQRLGRLRVHVGRLALQELAHPTLEALELSTTRADAQDGAEPWRRLLPYEPLTAQLPDLTRKRLPALKRLSISTEHGLDSACVSLSSSNILSKLSQLELVGQLGTRGVTALAAKLRRRPLDRLSVQGAQLGPESQATLRKACKELVIQDGLGGESPPEKKSWAEDRMVRHKRRPAWGSRRGGRDGRLYGDRVRARGDKAHPRARAARGYLSSKGPPRSWDALSQRIEERSLL